MDKKRRHHTLNEIQGISKDEVVVQSEKTSLYCYNNFNTLT